MIATLLLLGLFLTPLPHAIVALTVAGALLVSRRVASCRWIALVDSNLLLLFAGLFVVTGALSLTGLPSEAVAGLERAGLSPTHNGVLMGISLIGSNTVGNVPLVMLLLSACPDLEPRTLETLAVYSTLSGNLLLVGSLANLIVVERAAESGVRIGFLDHARCGVPSTLLSLLLACGWFAATG